MTFATVTTSFPNSAVPLDEQIIAKVIQLVGTFRPDLEVLLWVGVYATSNEQDFLTWKSPDKMAETFGVSRDSIYRHARAFDLLEPRRRNVRFALERIIERAGEVEVNANAIVAAVSTYAKLNAHGQWIDRREAIDRKQSLESRCQMPLPDLTTRFRVSRKRQLQVTAPD